MDKGRKPKPSALKLVTGNPGKRPMNKAEAKVRLSMPAPPPFLSDDAKVEWGRVVGTLYNAGLMTELDRAALAAYCQAYGRWAQAERAIVEAAERAIAEAEENDLPVPIAPGLTTVTSNGNVINSPLVGIANKAHADVMRYAVEFGMTPSSRSRVTADPNAGKEADPLENFF